MLPRVYRIGDYSLETVMDSHKIAAVLSPVNVVKKINFDSVVEKWKELGEQLCDQNHELYNIPSNSNVLSSVIRLWLFGSLEGKKKTWRTLIWALDAIDETRVADTLMDFTEPLDDPTITFDNLSTVMRLVKPVNRPQVWSDLGFPSHRSNIISISNVDDYVKYYVNTCPDVSETWKTLYCSLYKLDEDSAMTEVQKVCTMKTNPTFTVENVHEILIAWAPQDMSTAFAPLLPHPRLAFIMENYATMIERCRACAEYCVNFNPDFRLLQGDTWSKFVKIMNKSKASQESLDVVDRMRKRTTSFVKDKMQFPREKSDEFCAKSSDNKPQILKQPQNTVRSFGEQETFTVMARGSEPFNYQWKRHGQHIEDSVHIRGANTRSLTVQNIQSEHMGQYSCTIKNEFGEIESQMATLNLKPHIIVSPKIVTTESMNEATLTVSATGTEPLMYQWMKDDEEVQNDQNIIYGGNTSVLTIKCTDQMDTGCYTCTVKNQFGEVKSRRAYLKLKPKAPPVRQKPERYPDRSDRTNSWSQNKGTKMPPEPNGYTLRDQHERSESQDHGFIPASEPIITEHPRNHHTTYGDDITLSVASQGSEPLTYQWRKSKNDVRDRNGITGAKTSMLTIHNFQLAHTGNYCCVVSNRYGQTKSFECTVGMKPTFTESPPMRLCKVVGDEVVFQALAIGSKPLTYQWKKDGILVLNDPKHKGAETSKLTVRKVTSTHSGSYICCASNEFGETMSQECVLKVEDMKNEQTAKVVAQDLFKLLNLSQYYPQKLTLSDALCITQETLQSTECTDPKKLCLYILEKLMSYHYKCRADLFRQEQEESDDDDDIFRRKSVDSKVNKTSNSIHPMDSLLALIHCADDFLRQDLLFRLAKCQLSVPLILPDPSTGQLTYLTWALRSIVKEWKSTLKGSEQAEEAPLVTSKIPIVSFVRFNKSKSKSKMMNDVISDEYHDYFFHRDCQGGRYKRLLGEGLVDLCWYLPGGKKDDVFPLPIAFQNLHGDARKHKQQIEFMSQTCYMSFALITDDDLDDETVEVLEKLSKTPEGIILLQCSAIDQSHLFEKIKNIPEEKLKGFEIFNKNVDELKTTIRKRIKAKLANKKWITHEQNVKTLLECKNTAHRCHITVDEDKSELHEGQQLAGILHQMIRREEASAKEKMLPLQGEDLWQKWAKRDKEEHRPVKRGTKRAVDFSEEMHLEKRKIRELQVRRLAQESSKLINTFIDHVSSVKGNRRKYFLNSLKLSLNDQSRVTISRLQQKYKEKRSELLKAESGSDITKLKEIKGEIQVLQKEIIRVSLGLEHFLREMGQVYEATRGSHLENKYRCLPSVAAELLIDGFPLEIMDGDAAHVPEKWITAVMRETVKQLKNPNVFVMSVLGLQSTGKSTLINTAFGLQFNVSAGRCTRGAFMQLIPVGGTLKKESKCDYIMVVDTEGLRAPELDSQQTHKHDNELATFVTGLANVTMINIYGETPGDMDDILQTTVHALLRMRNVRLTPSCKFVHQNVGAVAAGDKGGMGRARFKDKLDDMTRIAAKAEECENDYKHFKDVIKFNEEADVFHFKGLWKGDPPMAPVNIGYSEAALNLKHSLVQMVRHSTTKFSSVATRTEDLWKALLHENFVFSFRNTLELNIYTSLDAQFIQWSRSLGTKMLKWEEETMEMEIKRAKDPQTLKDTLIGKKIPTYVVEIFGEVEQEMKKYFEQSEHREVLVQWQKETENRLERLKFQLQNEAKDHCLQMIKGQQAHNEISSETSSYRAKVKERVQDVVRNLSDKELKEINEDRLKKIFDQEWKKWLDDLRSMHVSAAGQTNVSHSVEEVLIEYFKTEQSFLYRNLPVDKWGKKLELEVPPTPEHVKGIRFSFRNVALNDKQKKEAKAVAKTALTHAKGYLQDVKNKTFHPALVHELLKLVDTSITKCTHQLTFTKEYRMIVSLTACGYAVGVFKEMVKAFEKKNDPVELWKKEENKLYTYFKNQYEEQVDIVKKREAEQRRREEEIAALERKAKAERERVEREEREAREAAERAKALRDEADRIKEEARLEKERLKREAEEAERKERERIAEEKAEKERKEREEKERREDARRRMEGAARIICDLIAESLESYVNKSLSSEVYEDMVELTFLKTKSALKAEILTSLGEEVRGHSNVNDFVEYLTDVESSFKTWLERYTSKHCQQNSRLVSLAKGALQKKFEQLKSGVENASYHCTGRSLTSKTWLEELCSCVSSIDVDWKTFHDLDGEKSLDDIHHFEQEIKHGLEAKKASIETNLKGLTAKVLDDQQNRPYDRFYKDLCGCCEQCPFCGEQCDSTNKDHSSDHCVQQHRPQCLGGYRWESTGIMVTDVCSSLVGSDNYFTCKDTNGTSVACKNYRSIYPNWSITIDLGAESSSYWKWFLANYCDEIADYYEAKASDIPESWRNLQWNDVKCEMRKSYTGSAS